MRIVSGAFDRVHGNLLVLSQVRGQRRIPYLPEERVHELRDARIRETVSYAAETVPYYRDLFRREGIDGREITGAAELEQLPRLSRAEVQEDPDRFVSQSKLGRESIPFRTTGSTGTPVRYHHDRRSVLQNIAYAERGRHVEVRLLGRELGYTKVSLARSTGTGAAVRSLYDRMTWIPLRPRRRRVDFSQPLGAVIAEIDEAKPDIIRGYGSFVELLFRHVAANDIRMHLPRVIVYGSDTMTLEGRELIEREFGIPVVSRYNATECFQIAHFCEERRDFHVQADICHLLIVRADGTKAAPGEQGEIVLTNLVNRGSVFLNYRIGDTAALRDGRCSCGRTSPLLAELAGRVEDIVRLDDGTLVFPRSLWDIVKQHREILRYQLVQLDPGRFELRLVTAAPAQFEPLAAEIEPKVARLYGGARIETVYHEALEPGPGGKFRSVAALR